jgi:hypothetical protein
MKRTRGSRKKEDVESVYDEVIYSSNENEAWIFDYILDKEMNEFIEVAKKDKCMFEIKTILIKGY